MVSVGQELGKGLAGQPVWISHAVAVLVLVAGIGQAWHSWRLADTVYVI